MISVYPIKGIYEGAAMGTKSKLLLIATTLALLASPAHLLAR